jgi:RNA polymerase sigma-70 factor (ECF subfamily)
VSPERNWLAVVERLLDGDERAFLELARLVNQFLAGWRAYDFADEWEDLVQEVVTTAAVAVREGRIRESGALPGYLRAVTRNKFADRLKLRLRGTGGGGALAWDEWIDGRSLASTPFEADLRVDVAAALARLPEKRRQAVVGVVVEGKTYEQASRDLGIPLGSLKRYLRDGLSELRDSLRGHLGDE